MLPQKLRAPAGAIGRGLLDLLFPQQCPGCDRTLVNEAFPICPRCIHMLERVDEAMAKRSICRLPEACNAFTRIFSLWIFDKAGTVQRVHQRIKYKNSPYHGLALGKLMGEAFLLPLHPQDRPDLILPIPLHWKRLFERGYNQSELLAAGMGRVSGIQTSTRMLTRSAYTKSQTGLDRHARRDNVLNAFSVPGTSSLEGKHILLVDDVLTTGATLLGASIPLKAAGAAEVSIATLAMARP